MSQKGKKVKKESNAKLLELREIEERIQKQWEEKKLYEVNPDPSREKYFITFPYPYMNGYLHLGHAFSMTKGEFMGRYQRMKGKNVLWPFGYHCTGQPIVACANKLNEELEKFGTPPTFPVEEETEGEEEEKPKPKPKPKKKQKGGKKKGGKKEKKKEEPEKKKKVYQYRIMERSGFEPEAIPQFKNPEHWVRYFPSHAVGHLKSFGTCIDHRRSFVTTNMNPYYDKFVEWQFMKLKEQDYLRFGKRISIYCPKDKQLCADHGRAQGEGVGSKEFSVIKMKLTEPYPKFLEDGLGQDKFTGKGVYLGAATLRPETMYGQTNCWLKPGGEYGAYELKSGEILIVSDRSARNLSFQYQLSGNFGEFKSLVPLFKGDLLFGHKLSAPLTPHKNIYILPMDTIDMKKTTGVVTSVPSDSPDDYACLMDFRNKKGLREHYGIKMEMVTNEIIPILETEKYGKFSAKKVVEEAKIKSHKDVARLREVHDEVYKEGFYRGTMIVGKYAGKPVSEVKELIKKDMIESGEAILYYEPEELVVSRSGCVCVSALTDQWYIRYGEEEWRKTLLEHVKNPKTFKTYSQISYNMFLETIDWLRDWGCSRSFGMGTSLPFDKQYLIESLSDSTIYMAYYTICHFLQSDIIGEKAGLFGVGPEEMTPEVFDHLFTDGPVPKNTKIPKDLLAKAKSEFEYWYPVDIRVSAKDLVKNHLTMFLYTHVAVFKKRPEFWPRSIFTNGYIKVNNQKMSKSTGNFKLLTEGVHDYSADGMRIALADGGDSNDDANFEHNVATASTLKLHTHMKWCRDMVDLLRSNTLRTEKGAPGSEAEYLDQVFDARMKKLKNLCIDNYEKMRYRDVLKFGWFELEKAKDWYEYSFGKQNKEMFRQDLMEKYMTLITLLMAPIIPHTSEYVWQDILGKGREATVVDQAFPEPEDLTAEDVEVLERDHYITMILHYFRQQKRREKKKKDIVGANVFICKEFEDWQIKALDLIKTVFEENGETNIMAVFKNMRKISTMISKEDIPKEQVGKMMKFISLQKRDFGIEMGVRKRQGITEEEGEKQVWVHELLRTKTKFDEVDFWKQDFIIQKVIIEMGLEKGCEFNVKFKNELSAEEAKKYSKIMEACLPSKPQIGFILKNKK